MKRGDISDADLFQATEVQLGTFLGKKCWITFGRQSDLPQVRPGTTNYCVYSFANLCIEFPKRLWRMHACATCAWSTLPTPKQFVRMRFWAKKEVFRFILGQLRHGRKLLHGSHWEKLRYVSTH